MAGIELRRLVNLSVNQTLGRSILTHVTTLLASLSLLIFGGPALHDFSIAMCIGVVVGAYSSIYIASPIYIWLRERMQKKAPVRATAA
jgi:preprotein translocase subunit SecF